MEESMKRLLHEYDADFHRIADKGSWSPEEITRMKDLQKLMYYIEVRCAMKEGEEYPGSEYMDVGKSYARGGQRRNPVNGQYMSYRTMDGNRYYDDGRGYGRRYYDTEDAIHKLHKLMDSENNPEFKMAIQEAIHTLEAK